MQVQSVDMRGAGSRSNPQKRILAFGLVGAIHFAVIWAIVVGLYNHGSITAIVPFHTFYVKPPKQEIFTKQPPDITRTFVKPHQETAIAPDFTIDTDNTNTITVAHIDPHPQIPGSAVQGIMNTHTIPPYPAPAVRGGIQGTVTLRLEIDADGNVGDATVANSSGSAVLDDAAVAWVKAHWRYRPATAGGTAIASTTMAAVTFNLKNAR